MANIQNISEAWAGHSGLEVETFLKSQLSSLVDLKFGYVEWSGTNLVFYDKEGGTQISSISLGGEIYSINIESDLGTVFYILGTETTKNLTLTPTTTKGEFGSSETEPYPEGYSYTMSVDSGNGYVPRLQGNIGIGESLTVDVRPYVIPGDNYIRFSFTGSSSGQTKSLICTATLTSLYLTCNHPWQTPWEQFEDYTISGIRFAGSVEKVLHIAVDGTQVGTVTYSPNQSYTTTSTSYTINSSDFPASASGVHEITLWMTAQGVSTPVISLNTMCVMYGDTTPLICVNSIAPTAVNFTSGSIFAYAVYNASFAKFNVSATMGSSETAIPIVTDRVVEAAPGVQYPFSVALEIESEANSGVLTSIATAIDNAQVEGQSQTITQPIDNTYSYLATPGALFYMNPANRSNGEDNRETIINEGTPDSNFSSTYAATWNNFSWAGDGWATDPSGNKCLVVPARSSVSVPALAPMSRWTDYTLSGGMTIEMMIQSGHPSDYNTPIITLSDDSTLRGITIYPTKIVVLGSDYLDVTRQMVNLCEDRITHLAIVFTRNYGGNGATFNLCSIYVNGTSNINFAFGSSTSFGSGSFKIGAPAVDTYIYKMRIYGKALESRDVLNNFLNCIIDGGEFTRSIVNAKNNIIDGDVVAYNMVKAAGFNTMIITIPSDSTPLPDVNHDPRPDSLPGCSMRFEYADHPEWNVTVGNLNLDGQGTTSMKYYRWNLRGKTGSSTTWTYDSGDIEDSTGKKGYFAGTGYPQVDRITAKKNYASSMQGHKMGLTGLYDDLFTQIGLKSELPSSNFNVAVYQFPFVGFRYYAQSGAYEYIGLYTAGPDKSSKVTFGYKDTYPNLLSLEGPNHAPLGTRFLHPWVDVTYDPADETLKFGGEEGWDCDYVNYETSTKGTQADWDAIMGLYTSEFKPAYDLVYHCSPYIASIAETGYANIAAINADIDNFRAASTGGVPNNLLALYDANYDLYFYRTKNGDYENLTTIEGSSAHNIKTYLGLTGSPTTAQIKAARAAKFKAEMGNYWSVNQTLYHYCFCVLLGITDNFAKNSYPVKFRGYNETLGAGESVETKRWGWRQDDLDTAFITDNNGMQTKAYYVEHGDLNASDGAEIFQGGSSALWVLVRDNFADEICTMMGRIASAAAAIASSLGITGSGPSGSLFNVISYYCWEHSAKYFSQTLYEEDRVWSYITPWLLNPSQAYNNVFPLTQALGDQYQAERLWVERRIAYVFSKYKVGEFTQDKGGSSDIAFTLGTQFTFGLKPAIELYPVITQGSTDYRATRTPAGTTASLITIPSSTNTTVYIHGADWLSSLGDLHTMAMVARGGATSIPFSVTSRRMEDLIIGGASGVLFNATSLAVTSPTIKIIDARNTATITDEVSLLNCPRLKEVYFAGSGARGLVLPVGARITDVSFPSNVTTLYVNSLHFLENVTWPSNLADIESLYIVDTPIDSLGMLDDIMNTSGNSLQNITMIGDFEASLGELTTLRAIAVGNYGRVVYDGNYTPISGGADIEGTLTTSETDPLGANMIHEISKAFPSLVVLIPESQQYIDFEDAEVERIALANWDTDHNGVLMLSEASAVPRTGMSGIFSRNTTIETFNELPLFKNATNLPNSSFYGCTALREIDTSNIDSYGQQVFTNCTSLEAVDLSPLAGSLPMQTFWGCASITSLGDTSKITIWGERSVQGCSMLESVDLSSATLIYAYAFAYDSSLRSLGDTSNVEEIRGVAFRETTSLAISLNFPKLTVIQSEAFYGSGITGITSLGNITTILSSANSGTFQNCTSLTTVNLPATIEEIQAGAFRGCSLLATVNGLEKVKVLGNHVFRDCVQLGGDLNLANLTSIGAGAFIGTAISRVVSLGVIQVLTGNNYEGAFYNCTSLTSVTLPSTLTEIGLFSFYGCTSLRSINFPSNLQKINNNAFTNCPIDYVISIPTLTLLGAGSFQNTGIPKVENLGSITAIGNSAFSSCTALTEVNLPSTLTTIGQYAFAGCTALTKITFNATSPGTLGYLALQNCNVLKELLVPPASFYSYITAWSGESPRIFPHGGNNPNAIIANKRTEKPGNNYAIVDANGYAVTFVINVDRTHIHTIDFGFASGGDYSGMAIWAVNEYNSVLGTYDHTTTSTSQTYTPLVANTVGIRVTIKLSELASCSIHDDTTDEYLWRGSDVTTIYSASE